MVHHQKVIVCAENRVYESVCIQRNGANNFAILYYLLITPCNTLRTAYLSCGKLYQHVEKRPQIIPTAQFATQMCVDRSIPCSPTESEAHCQARATKKGVS